MPDFDEVMQMVSRPDYQPTLDQDINAYLGSLQTRRNGTYYISLNLYKMATRDGQRIGQAFMNALPDEQYYLLNGTIIDPFHKDDFKSVYIAIDYLLMKKAGM